MLLRPLPISSLLNECTLVLIGLICTKKMKGGGEREGERLVRKGERKSSEWHHNITMQWWAQLANTAGPATVKSLMSPNSKQTLDYEFCFYSITSSRIHRNTYTHTHFGFMAFTHICLQNIRAIITCKHYVLCYFNSVIKKSHLNDLFGVQSEVKISKDKMGKLFVTLVCNPG